MEQNVTSVTVNPNVPIGPSGVGNDQLLVNNDLFITEVIEVVEPTKPKPIEENETAETEKNKPDEVFWKPPSSSDENNIRILDAVSGFLSWSKFIGNHNDDFIDRINHIYTVIVLTIFSIVVTGGTFIGDSISCWLPQEAASKQRFVETTCWTGTTYYVDDDDSLTTGDKTVVHYYLWVPIILLFQAFLFKIPNIVWQMTNKASGMNLDKISTLSEKTQMESEDHRLETIEHIGNYIERWICANKIKSSNIVYRFRPKPGSYLTIVFFLTKVLYCVNVISQFYIVSALMKINFAEYGLKVSSYLESSEVMMDPTIFPRVVYCKFHVRQLHNVLNMTTQCVLPINVLNEKVFMFLWFWFCVVATLSIMNLIHWIYRIVSKGSYIDYIFRYINISDQTLDRTDRKACARFVNRFLNLDIVMLLRVVGKNSTDLVVADLLGYLWTMYKKKCQTEENKMIDA